MRSKWAIMSAPVALSWPNLPCALKAAIGIGKRTLGDPHQSAAPQGAAARPWVRGPPSLGTQSPSRHALAGTRGPGFMIPGANFQNAARFGRAGLEFLSGSPRASPFPSLVARWRDRISSCLGFPWARRMTLAFQEACAVLWRHSSRKPQMGSSTAPPKSGAVSLRLMLASRSALRSRGTR